MNTDHQSISKQIQRNVFRSNQFIKIKHSLQSCILPTHLESCRTMMDNATSILLPDEMTILLEYYQTAHDLIYPIHAKEWEGLVAMQSK